MIINPSQKLLNIIFIFFIIFTVRWKILSCDVEKINIFTTTMLYGLKSFHNYQVH